ncbi:MAG: tetratricopeptide repeat protein, partial [Verrucomicrobiota bacterium]
LNIALIDAGDRLSAARRYNEAMLMYRMVLSVADIIAWQEQQLASITTQLDRLKLSGVENERMVELETEKFNTEAQLQALRKLTPYEADLQIRIARTFFLTGRDWESFYAYRDLIERYPDNANIEDFIYAAFTAASELQLTDDVIALGQFYKEDPQRTKYLSDITLKLAQYYLDSGDYENFYVLARSFINKNPTDPYAAQILYMMGSFYLQQGRLDDILVEFNDYLILYPDSAVTEGCHYWIGLADIFIGDYDDALVQFSAILEKYPRSIYSEDALYRRGIAYFGKQDFENAQQDFRTFVETYPSSTLRGEVEFFIADGYAATGQMKAALRHYAAVEQYTDSPTFIRNSYFNRAKLFEANNRYDEMAEILTAYMTKYEADGDLAGALFELGRARELQGSPELMLEDYSTGIMSFGNDPKAYGIDYIIDVYAEKYHENLNRIDQNIAFFDSIVNDKKFREKIITDRAFLFEYLAKNPAIDEEIQRKFYNRAYREALRRDTAEIEALLTKNRELNARYPKELPVDTFKRLSSEAADKNLRTLALRLDMALDELGAETESGRLFTRRDISAASPETLIWIGQQTSSYDPELALSAYQTVIDKHPDVEDSRLTALLALAALAVEAESYEEAQGYYLQAIQEFPAHPDTVDAMLGQANALLNQKKFEEAREKYVEITNRREWRGEPQAEALFQIGLTHYENGLRTGDPEEFKKAQAFFQRVYIGYFAFTDWAAAAYYYSGQTLKQLGNPQDARSTYEEFLKDNTYADTEYYDRIQDAMSTL